MRAVDTSQKQEADRIETDQRITEFFGVSDPEFAFVCGGMRRIYVDPHDRRARKMLLRKGFKNAAQTHVFLHACMREFAFLDLFFDIGTNYGECLFAAPLYSKLKIIGCEANPALHPYLKRSLLHNEDLADISVLSNAMAADRGRMVTFQVHKDWSGASSVLLDAERKDVLSIEVETTTVDHELSLHEDIRAVLFKIDVEGFEPAVFDGAKEALSRLETVICLLEFDSSFITAGGVNASTFFNTLASEFDVYHLTGKDLTVLKSYSGLLEKFDEGKKIHADLVLTKFGDVAQKEQFQRLFENPIKQLRTSFFP